MSNTTNNLIIKKKKNILDYWYLLVVLVFIGSIFAQRANAITMSNGNYVLQTTDFTTFSGESSNSGTTLNYSGRQIPDKTIYNTGKYSIKTMSGPGKTSSPFTFSISENLIDFGRLSPTNPILRTNALSVSTGSSNGYSVFAYEDHPLRSLLSETLIPDTTCDDGACTEEIASNWTSSLSFGFGYRCDNISGQGCSKSFVNTSFYRHFANNDKRVKARSVMSGQGKNLTAKAQITYKINISGTQQPGNYGNTITYIATPTF